MNLYHVSQNVNNDSDTYSDFVVACEDEKEARTTNPSGFCKWHDDKWYFQYADGTEKAAKKDYSWCLPDQVKVKLIGRAEKSIKAGVICASKQI